MFSISERFGSALDCGRIAHVSSKRNQSDVQKPQFGWTQDTLTLNTGNFLQTIQEKDIYYSQTDVSQDSNAPFPVDKAATKSAQLWVPRLSSEKLDQILNALGRNNLEQPGFFVLKGLESIFKTPQSAELFLRWLMIDLAYSLNNGPASQRELYNLNTPQDHLILGSLKFMLDGQEQKEHPRYTHKEPHFENFPMVTALLYLPTQNVEGGEPQVYDLEQYGKDHPGLPVTIKRTRDSRDDEKEVLNSKLVSEKSLSNYSFTIPRKPSESILVLYKNKGAGRVAHGSCPLKIPDAGKFERRILGYNLQPHNIRVKPDDPNWQKYLQANKTET